MLYLGVVVVTKAYSAANRTWDQAYDTRFQGRLAQSAVDSYETWRAALVLRGMTASAAPAEPTLAVPVVLSSVPVTGAQAQAQPAPPSACAPAVAELSEDDWFVDLTDD